LDIDMRLFARTLMTGLALVPALVAGALFAAAAFAQDIVPGATPTSDSAPSPPALTGTPALTPPPTLHATQPSVERPTPMPSPTLVFVGRVTAIGDSVMLGAARELRRTIGGVDVDARVSRQASAAINTIRARHDSGRLGEVVIVHIGNNGPITATQFDQLMAPLKGARLVVIVNLRVPRRWEAGNNQVLAEGVRRYPNAVLMDWNGYVREHPGMVGGDGIHLGAKSARAYTSLVVDALLSPLAAPEAPKDISP
jgi:hypothetical protein